MGKFSQIKAGENSSAKLIMEIQGPRNKAPKIQDQRHGQIIRSKSTP